MPQLFPVLIPACFSIHKNTVPLIYTHIFTHLSFLGFCCHLCHHGSVSPGHCLQPLLLSVLSSKGVNPLLPDSWGSEPAVYPTKSMGLCFSEQGLCTFLCKALLSARVRGGAAACPCRAADCCSLFLQEGFCRQVPQSQALLPRHCCLRTSPEYIKRNFLLLPRKLVNISLGHGGRLQSPRFKGGQLSAALG